MLSIRSASRLVGALLTVALAVVVFATIASAAVKATTITIIHTTLTLAIPRTERFIILIPWIPRAGPGRPGWTGSRSAARTC